MNVTLPPVADPLGEALHFLRMSGILYCRSEFTAPWALALPPMKAFLMLHVVISGRCWLEVEGVSNRLLQLADEARELRPGGETVITRLADVLVIHAIRSWIVQDPAAQTGWLGALQDKQIGRVISLVHREPARAWTLKSLAAEAAMSRSVFAARFAQLVGESAMHYVTRWRMHMALAWLKENDAPVGELSQRLAYESETAFSRAFKRDVGVPPGVARRSRNTATRERRLEFR